MARVRTWLAASATVVALLPIAPVAAAAPHASPQVTPISMAEALAEDIQANARPASAPAPRAPHAQPTAHDKPTREKLAAGRLPIEGRVDLHGMTQHQAHALLLAFLARAHAGGVRYVLVITGKGSSSGGEGVLRCSVM